MAIPLDQVLQTFTPAERSVIDARTAELIAQELLRAKRRPAPEVALADSDPNP